VRLKELVRDDRMNAVIGWSLTGIVALGAIGSILTDVLLWGGFEL
jgi:hypothetical protein